MFCIGRKGQQDPNDTLNLIIKQCTICNYCVPALIPLIFRTQLFPKKIPIQGKCRRICNLKSYMHATELSSDNRESMSEHTQSPKNIKICSINIDKNLFFQTIYFSIQCTTTPLLQTSMLIFCTHTITSIEYWPLNPKKRDTQTNHFEASLSDLNITVLHIV